MATDQTKFQKRFKKNQRFKKKVLWYQKGQRRCHCCGIQLNWIPGHKNSASAEHMIPSSKGGTYDYPNILIVCQTCNYDRKTKDWIQFVLEKKMPKSEWLIQKYLTAVEFYRTENKKVCISIFQGVSKYQNKVLKRAA